MHIDTASPLPLYYQLRENIREKIMNGEWEYGSEIPSETQLCKELNLSRATVKQAFDGLVTDGLIVRKRGKGTYVNYKKISYNMMEEPNFYVQMEEEGASQYAIILEKEYIPADQKISEMLDVPVGSRLCYFKRIRQVDGIPMLIQTVYLPAEYEKGLFQQDLQRISFHKYIEEANHFLLDKFHMDIEAIILNEEHCGYLGIETPVAGFLFNTVYRTGEKKIIYNERVFRGDMINLSLNFDYEGKKRKKELQIFKDIAE